jgi:hypothetical protein
LDARYEAGGCGTSESGVGEATEGGGDQEELARANRLQISARFLKEIQLYGGPVGGNSSSSATTGATTGMSNLNGDTGGLADPTKKLKEKVTDTITAQKTKVLQEF